MKRTVSLVTILLMVLTMMVSPIATPTAAANPTQLLVGPSTDSLSISVDSWWLIIDIWATDANGLHVGQTFTVLHSGFGRTMTTGLGGLGSLPPGTYTVHIQGHLLGCNSQCVHRTIKITPPPPPPNAFPVITPMAAVAVPHVAPQIPVLIPVHVTDADAGDSVALTATTGQGTASVSGSAPDFVVTYLAAVDWIGSDTISLTASDGHNSTSGAIQLTRTNDAPTVNGFTTVTPHTNPPTPVVVDLAGHFSDGNADGMAVAIAPASHGTASLSGSTVTYTPSVEFVGLDQFNYTVTDAHGAPSQATVTIEVTDQAPTAISFGVSTVHDHPCTFPIVASDPDTFDSLTVSVSTPIGFSGSVAVNQGLMLTYTPAPGFVGDESFSYVVTDPHGATASAVVTVTVTNAAPVAIADTGYTVGRAPGSQVRIPVLSNDTDADDDYDALAIVTGAYPQTIPSQGTVSFDSNCPNELIFTPDADYAGPVSFSYTITDGHAGGQTTGTVCLTVLNTAPVAANDSAQGGQNRDIVIDVLANDSDPNPSDAASLIVSAVSDPLNAATMAPAGTATITDGGRTVTFHVNALGTFNFIYTVCDRFDATATGTVTVRIDGISPILECVTKNADSTYTAHWGWRSSYDTAKTVPAASSCFTGTVLGGTINPPTSFTTGRTAYFPNNAFDTIFDGNNLVWTLTDPEGVSRTATAGTGMLAATAVDDIARAGTGQTVTINVLDNDLGVLGATQIKSVSTPSNGTATISADGRSILYTSTAALGAHTLSYTVRQANVDSTATVTVNVNSISIILEVVTKLADGRYVAHWGWSSSYPGTVTVPVSKFTGNVLGGTTTPPTTITSDRTPYYPDNAFDTIFDGSDLVWTLTTPDGNTKTATANANSEVPQTGLLRVTMALTGDGGSNPSRLFPITVTTPEGWVMATGSVSVNASLMVELPVGPYVVTQTNPLPARYIQESITNQGAVTISEDNVEIPASIALVNRYTMPYVPPVEPPVNPPVTPPINPPVVVPEEPIPGGGTTVPGGNTTLPKTGGYEPNVFHGLGLAAVALGAALRKRSR